VIIAIVAVIAAVIAGIFFLTRDDDDDTASDDTSEQSDDAGDNGDSDDAGDSGDDGEAGDSADDAEAGRPTDPPTGQAEFDDLADDCYQGEMQACDELYNVTPPGSEYEEYGDTCGGRWPTSARPSCTAVIPDPLPPDD
jgi:hypothetical protein